MRAKCLMCGDNISSSGYCELSVNRYVCTKCVNKVKLEELVKLLEKKLDAKKAAANAKD